MITKLTKEQHARFPEFMDKWLHCACGETDLPRANKSILDMYKFTNEKPPLVIHFTSPFISIVAAAQLYSQLDLQLYSQLHSQLGAQLDLQLGSQIDLQLGSQLYSQYQVLWWCIWACYYDYAKYLGIKFDLEKLGLFTNFASSVHTCIPYKNICIYSHKPIACHWKGTQLHNENGMSVEYADGWGWYSLNGIKMKPEYVLTQADKLEPDIVLKEQDVDVRRELLRKVGVLRMSSYGKEIDKWYDYKLIDMSPIFTGIRYAPYLLMKNPSLDDTWHLEGVEPECKTVEDALHRHKPEEMRKIPIDDNNGEDWWQQGDVMIWPKQAISLKRHPIILT